MKKIITGIIMALVLSVSAAYAADGGAGKRIDINAALADPSQLAYSQGAVELTKDGDGYGFPDAGEQVVSFGSQDINGFIDCDMAFHFEGDQWAGFQFRAKDPTNRCWATTCYVVIVKSGNVEFQVFNSAGKTGYLANYNYTLPQDEKMNVKCGAIDTEQGTYLFLRLGDVMFGAMDADRSVAQAGYFNIGGSVGGITLYETEASEDYQFPMVLAGYNPETGKAEAEVISVSNTETALEPVMSWYLSGPDFVYDPVTKTTELADFQAIEGETGTELLLAEQEVGLYALCTANIGDYTVYSNVAYIDPVEYVLENGFVGRIGYNRAIGKGNVFTYDETSISVYPDEIDDAVYMPYRGVMEGFNYPVTWDAETRTVSVKTPDADAETVFSVDKKGFQSFKGLMGSAMNEEPKLIDDRTYLDLYTTSQILALDKVTYDAETGLIVLSKIDLELTADQISDLAYTIEEM